MLSHQTSPSIKLPDTIGRNELKNQQQKSAQVSLQHMLMSDNLHYTPLWKKRETLKNTNLHTIYELPFTFIFTVE